MQLVITTHNPNFLDLRYLEGLVVVRKDSLESSTYVTQLTSGQLTSKCQDLGAKMASVESIGEWYDGASTNDIKAGFFGRAVVLVEGPTESLSLPILFERLDVQLDGLGISVIPVGGKGNLAKWYRLFSAYDFKVYVIFDNDDSDDKKKTKRVDLLETMKVDEGDHARLLASTEVLVGTGVTVFGADFENAMRSAYPDYPQLESQAAELLGSSKPLVARWVAERVDLTRPNFLGPLSEQLKKLVEEGSGETR